MFTLKTTLLSSRIRPSAIADAGLHFCLLLGTLAGNSLRAVYKEGGRTDPSDWENRRRRNDFSLGLHAEILASVINKREGIKD